MNEEIAKVTHYRPEVDGLRAVAVLAVVLYHAKLGVSGGFVGVDIFFVISGYLITSLLLRELESGRLDIWAFWERRIRRIFPALTLMCLVTVGAGWFLFLPADFKKLGDSVIAQSLMGANFYFRTQANYFDWPSTDLMPLLHTWSLAVEEQFYLFFPLLVLLLSRLRKALAGGIFMAICVGSLAMSVYGVSHYPTFTFFLLPCRVWELGLGAIIAALSRSGRWPIWIQELLSAAGLLAIAYAAFYYDETTPFPGLAALLPCMGAALFIYSNAPRLTFCGRLLSLPPFVFLGLVSYSLYLWHWPVIVFSKYWALEMISQKQRLLLLLTSLVLAVLSWRFVELPFRRREIFKSRSQIFTFAGVVTAALIMAGLAVSLLQGVPSRLPMETLSYANGIKDIAFRNEVTLKEAINGNFVELGSGNKHLPIDVFVWGDSHAMAVMPIIDILCKEHDVRGVGATHSSTAPLVGYESSGEFSMGEASITYNDAVVQFIKNRRIKSILIVAKWRAYDAGGLREGLSSTINSLQEIGATIWIMKPVPEYPWSVTKALSSVTIFGGKIEEIGLPLDEYQKASQSLDSFFEEAERLGFKILDPTDCFSNGNGRCRIEAGGKALYWDHHHLTVTGAMLLRPMFQPVFTK